MRAILQRVSCAEVRVNGSAVGRIGPGWLILMGVRRGDTLTDLEYLVEKTLHLRAFPDDDGKMNLNIQQAGGAALVVSQFTVYGDCRKGRRPSFTKAAPPEEADRMYREFTDRLGQAGLEVATGRFGAHMEVDLVNDGPVTFILDSQKSF